MTQNVKKPSRFSATSHAWAALLLCGLSLGLTATACDEECTGDDCHTCSDDECSSGQRCVQNECRNACSKDGDCSGVQVCGAWRFKANDEGNFCVVLPGTVIPDGGVGEGRFSDCKADAECDVAHGFSCVEGECNYPCRSHADCAGVGHCDSRVIDDERRNLCVRDENLPKPGGLNTACPNGTECSDARLCLGAGEGDLDAYCTVDCASDDDCAVGYSCGSITRSPCEDACTSGSGARFGGQPDDPRCVPAALIGADQPYQCGELGLVRRVCRQREFCSPCQTDADCLAAPNQVCARDESGEKICTRLCDTGSKSCPWGNAARCGNFDEDVGAPTCSHRFKSCFGTGQTCEPCRSDDDCPGGLCASSSFTGERWCINLSTRCECLNGIDAAGTCVDGGCPDSPAGLAVMCIGDEDSGLFNLCYAANSSSDAQLGASPQTGCWDPN